MAEGECGEIQEMGKDFKISHLYVSAPAVSYSLPKKPPVFPSGTGQSCRVRGPAGAADVKGEGEPDVDLQAGRISGCRVSAQTAGGEPCGV